MNQRIAAVRKHLVMSICQRVLADRRRLLKQTFTVFPYLLQRRGSSAQFVSQLPKAMLYRPFACEPLTFSIIDELGSSRKAPRVSRFLQRLLMPEIGRKERLQNFVDAFWFSLFLVSPGGWQSPFLGWQSSCRGFDIGQWHLLGLCPAVIIAANELAQGDEV